MAFPLDLKHIARCIRKKTEQKAIREAQVKSVGFASIERFLYLKVCVTCQGENGHCLLNWYLNGQKTHPKRIERLLLKLIKKRKNREKPIAPSAL